VYGEAYLRERRFAPGSMSNRRNYPQSVDEVIDPGMTFRPGVLAAVYAFKRSYPWRGTLDERKSKFLTLHQALCAVYGKRTILTFERIDGGPSDDSSYCPATDTICLRGKLSVVTYLHEVAHALGRDERGAAKWSLNLFKRCFPRLFANSVKEGHVLRAPPKPTEPQA